MMSHEDDWIGQTHGGEFSGRNNGQVYVSYFDNYGGFIHADFSPPMDSTYAASEWHHMHVESMYQMVLMKFMWASDIIIFLTLLQAHKESVRYIMIM